MSDGLRRIEEAYGRSDKALSGYVAAMATFVAGAGVIALASRLTGRRPPRLPPYELACLAVATHKVSRIVAKNAVTSPLRAPFTRFEGTAGHAELTEDVQGGGRAKAVGELLTCPFCLGPWVATTFMAGYTFVPTFTRATTSMLAAVAGSDFLQLAYAAAQQRVEPASGRRDA